MVTHTITINEKPTLKYPKSIGFIISNEFCERFNFYGMRTILVLYLTRKLNYDNDTATVLYHIFTSLVYFFPIIGAIIADSWLGRFKTIVYLSIVYCIGTVIISVGAIPVLNLPASTVTVIGLLLIAIGTGGIKPCVSAFGGDQFKLPEQARQLAMFFSLFYFTINAGSLISTSITPILREDVHCFNELDCFSLAFGVPASLMVLSIVIFIMGKSLYVIKKPVGNMIVSVSQCIFEAIRARSKQKNICKKEHWLDYAESKCGKQLVNDTKSLLKILVLYLPLPIFWALFDQQGSRWTFQATRMVGDIGGATIKPDQMQVINPFLILVFIPLFDYCVYPILEKVGIKRPLQKLTLGGLLAGFAFVLSGLVELSLEQTDPVLPGPEEAQLRIYNALPCNYQFLTSLKNFPNFSLPERTVFEEKHFSIRGLKYSLYEANPIDSTSPICTPLKGNFKLESKTATSYFITRNGKKAGVWEFEDSVGKPKRGLPAVRLLASVDDAYTFILRYSDMNITINTNNTDLVELPASGSYDIFLNSKFLRKVQFKLGGVYVLMLDGSKDDGYELVSYTLTQPNSIHMLWQLPQYMVITAGEVMFSVTGLEFSFSQAPASMKSVLTACWLLAVAFGNLIVVLIAEFTLFESQSAEFFLFAFLMVLDMLIFILLAIRYKYIDVQDGDDDNPNVNNGTELSKTDNNVGHENKSFQED